MEYGCPVCNGFVSIGDVCPNCHHVMDDLGRVEDLYTPYSPYEEQDDIPVLQEAQNSCVHVFLCPECNAEENIIIPFEKM